MRNLHGQVELIMPIVL